MSPTTGSAPRLLALEVLAAVERGARSDRALDGALARHKLADADRRLATEIIYGTLRRQGSLDRALAPHCDRDWKRLDAPLRAAARMAAYQALYLRSVPPHAAVDATVGALKARRQRGAGLVNAVLRSWARAGCPDGHGEDMAQRLDVPQWLAQRWVARWGTDASEAWFAAALRPAVAGLALHPRVAVREETVAVLDGAGVQTEPSPWVSGALRLPAGGHATTLAHAAVTPRSEASQLVTSLLSPGGQWALDACAGRGGKAIQLAEIGVADRVLALDVHGARLRACRLAAGRAQTPEVLVARADAARLPCAQTFDRILVDAPCSGLGTLRRHPEIRWRIRPRDLERLASTQRDILRSAVDALRPGGELLYVTCSTEPEENEQVVQWLLQEVPGAELLPLRAAPPVDRLIGEDGMLRTYPAEPDLDGFFAARLTRP